MQEEYDAFEHLCDVIFQDDEDGLMFYWKAHFDASGKHSPLLVVAGYLAARPQWKTFNQAWKIPITKDGKTVVFHATDFEGGYKDFTLEKGWTDSRKKEARIALVNAIEDAHLRASVVCSVVIPDYEEMITGWRRERMGSVYEFCVNSVLKAFGIYSQEIHQREPIAFIVEDGEGGEGKIQDAFYGLSKNKQFKDWLRMGSLTFLPKDQALGLQAADMLANYYWRHLNGALPDIEPYNRIIHSRTCPLIVMHYDKKEFERLHAKEVDGVEVKLPEFTASFSEPLRIPVRVTADFTEAERVLEDLETLSDTAPEVVHALVKNRSQFEKLFTVEAQNVVTANTGVLGITLKPKQLTLHRVSALRAAQSKPDLVE
ncbi:MAG TPA: DUF3800 domain-containing protein [Pyrinomonadaceae bacterium]|nr:DUF3800 domain-containing protein [Pyrinomonadaceae bacterium]